MANRTQNQQNLESVINRYDRQELIAGWDQKKLSSANVVVAGSDILAEYIVMALSALGFGYIEIYAPGKADRGNYSRGFIPRNDTARNDTGHAGHNASGHANGRQSSRQGNDESKAAVMAGFAQKLNPLITANGVALDLSRARNLSVLEKPQVIFDATNDPASKIELLEYSLANKCLFISLSSGDDIGRLGLYDPRWRKSEAENSKIINNIIFSDMENRPQDPYTGMMISALAADEARKYLMPVNDEKLIEDVIVQNMHSNKRFNNSMDRQIAPEGDGMSGKKVLIVGAGGLGNPVSLGLSMTDLGALTIIDGDIVESTNLNRQPLFYDSVGRKKAPALVEKLRRINPDKTYEAVEEFLGLGQDKFFKEGKFDLIIDCVDNDKTRALLNYYSLKHNIPLISSATRYNSGHVNISVPGKTSCLNCQREIDKYATAGHRQESASCIYAPQASVITSNMTIAGMVLCEARVLLDPKKYGEPIGYELKYMSQDDFRVGALPLNKSQCDCQDSKKLDSWPERMEHLYKKKDK